MCTEVDSVSIFMAKRTTPIEQYIEDGEALTPKQRYEKSRKVQGFIRRAYYVHVDDEEAVLAFVKSLESKRGWSR